MSNVTEKNSLSDTRPSFTGSRWLNLRRMLLSVITIALLCTFFGIFLMPSLVKDFTVQAIKDATGRDAAIAEIEFDPMTLSIQVKGFDLSDTTGDTLLSIDELVVKPQVSSLFSKPLSFREIQLNGAHVFFERFSPDDDSLSRLLADIARHKAVDSNGPPTKPTRSDGLPRLLIGTLSLKGGTALLRDHVGSETVEIPIGPISATVHDLSTLPDLDGDQGVQLRLPHGGLLTWQGDLQLQPFHSVGHLALEDASFDFLTPYLTTTFPIESFVATLSANSEYSVAVDELGGLSISLSNLTSKIEGLAASGLSPSSKFLTFSELAITGGELRFPENTLKVASVRIVDPYLDAWLDEDREPALAKLIGSGGSPDNDAKSGVPWHVSVAELEIENGQVDFDDKSMQPNLAFSFENVSLQLQGINNHDLTEMPLLASFELDGGGKAKVDASVVLLPDFSVKGNITADGVPLNMLQPYAQQSYAVTIEDGELDTSSEFSFAPGKDVHLAGNLTINNFAVHDTVENEKLLAWKHVFIDRYEVGGEEADLRISTVAFSDPFCRLHIRKDLSTNFSSVFIESDGESAPDSGGGSDGESSFTFVLGNLAVDNGSMEFSDFSLPLPFVTTMQGMNGTLSAVDNRSEEPSDIRLEGRVDDYGIARIHGIMNFLDPVARTNLSVEFRNLMMTNLSAYAAQFAGREIDQGKLDLELEYVITDGLLSGVNSAVLSDLVLGKKVESPDAINLPLNLAVALLKDTKGVIDIKLLVEGDINHPEFKLQGLVRHTAASLLNKTVNAPFKALARLMGIASDDFGEFKFLGGRQDLAPPELERLALLKQALVQRPEVVLQIGGTWSEGVDLPALQWNDLRATVGEHLRHDHSKGIAAEKMFDEEVLRIFEEIHAERFPGSTLDRLKARHTVPPPHEPGGKPVFDQTAYASALRKLLVDSQPVTKEELSALADQRAQAIADALLADGQLKTGRIRMIKPIQVESKDGEWVAMKLGVCSSAAWAPRKGPRMLPKSGTHVRPTSHPSVAPLTPACNSPKVIVPQTEAHKSHSHSRGVHTGRHHVK